MQKKKNDMDSKWLKTTLGKCLDFTNGKTKPNEKGDLNIYGSNGTIGNCKKYNSPKNTIVIGRVGNYCGSVHFSKEACWVTDNALKAVSKDGNNAMFFYYFLKSFDLGRLRGGSGQPLLTQSILNSIEIISPPNEEQEAIANILGSIDDKIKLNNELNKRVEKLIKVIFEYWFVQFDFPDKNGMPYKSSGGIMNFNNKLNKKIPAGWSCGNLDDLGKISGGATPSKKDSMNFTNRGVAWLTPSDMSNNKGYKFISHGALDITSKGIRSASLEIYPKNTVLLTSRAPVGYMAISNNEVTTNQGFKSIIPNKGYPVHFVFNAVASSMKVILNFSSGSTFKEIAGSTLKLVPICLPPIDLSIKFSKKVEKLFELQKTIELENKKLSNLRDWLLPLLITGKIRVN